MLTEDRTEDRTSVDERPIPRWGRVFAAGTAVIAGLATVLYQARPAMASGNCGTPCCWLAYCNRSCQPNGKPLGWNCPSGYFRTGWTCVWGGTHHALCGECSHGTNCDAGPWACSIWFIIN
ncbi:MAG TPA: hypothetical protein VE953_17760 [Terriglobales bacterium]|nr:hypothetical protein [Terriglobales bacterium]